MKKKNYHNYYKRNTYKEKTVNGINKGKFAKK